MFGTSGITSSILGSSDYWKRDNMFSLRYCNWNKDMFMGILPNSQFGDVAFVNLGGSGSGTIPVGFLSDTEVFTQAFNATAMSTVSDTSPMGISGSTSVSAVIQMGEVAPVQSKTLLDPLTVGTDIPFCTLNGLSSAVSFASGNVPLGATVTVPSDLVISLVITEVMLIQNYFSI